MKSHGKFILVILLMLVAVVVIEYRMPRRFIWQPTFSHSDAQPFGCLVFDSVMKASLPNGYTVDRRTLFQLFQDGVITHPKFYKDSVATSPKSLVIITKEMIGEGTRDYILQLADEGNTVMVATTYLNEWADTLGFDFRWNNSFILSEVAGNNLEKDTLKWVSDMPKDSVYAQVPLWQSVYPQMIERTLLLPDSVPHDNLLIYNGTREGDSVCEPVAVSFSIGSGELILVSSPLLLTNYMTLDGNGSALQGRLMNRLKANPVIRTEAYMSVTAQEESSPFYVLLREPPLRWALYLTLLGILLFCVFTARRRQRVISVVNKPQNRNLEFVKLIGTLYWQEHWNPGLLSKKLAYTEEEIRHHHARLSDDDLYFLNKVREAASGNHIVSDEELKIFIKELDRIQQSL